MMNERQAVCHSSFIIPHSSFSLLVARALLALLLRRLDLARARGGRGRGRRFVVRRDVRGRRLRLLRAGLGGGGRCPAPAGRRGPRHLFVFWLPDGGGGGGVVGGAPPPPRPPGCA